MFNGVGTAIITPFDRNDNVDYSALKKIVGFQVDAQVDALIVLGTTGEAPVITDEERKKIISVVVEEAKGKTQIIVGTGTNDTKHVIRLNKMAEELKADGLLIVNPYYNKGTQESLVEHYKYICEQTDLPIILYNVPSRTGMNLLPQTVIRIYEDCKNVVAVKEASGDISQIAKLCASKPDDLLVYSGNDDQMLPVLALGGSGVVSVLSNAFPSEMKQLYNAFLSNEVRKAQQLQNKLLDLMNALFVETNPMPVKYLIHKLGYCENTLRLPLTTISENSEKLIDELLEKISVNAEAI